MLRFAKHLNLAGLGLRSMQSYYRDLDLLSRFTGKDPAYASVSSIRDYIVHVKCELGWAPKTIRKAIAAMKHFYRDMLGKKIALLDQIKAPDRQSLPEVLSGEEIVRIFREVRFGRYRTPLLLCYGSGLRIGECVNLHPEDIRGKDNKIFVRCSKGGKDHYTILSSHLHKELQRYWKRHKNRCWVFPRVSRGPASVQEVCRRMGQASEPMGRTGLGNALTHAVRAAGILRKISCHTLRHSFASHLVDDGVPIMQIQEYLGHANIETTTAYIHLATVSHEKALDCMDSMISKLL